MQFGNGREHKYLIDRHTAREVLRAARAHLEVEVYDSERPIAYARTIYLDARDARYLRSSAESARVRIRLRQYAAARDLIEAPVVSSATWLELKRTAGFTRHKVRISMSAGQAIALATGRLPDAIGEQLATEPRFDELVAELRNGLLAPAATTWYRRLSLVGDGVRLTFDEAIAFCRPSFPIPPGDPAEPSSTLARERRTIVELKTAAAIPPALAKVLARLPPALEYSKFHAAMAAAAPPHPRRDGTVPLPVLS